MEDNADKQDNSLMDRDISVLIHDSSLLFKVKTELDKFIVGEDANKLLLFLVCASSHTNFNLSAVITGSSSAGKSWLKDNVLKLFDNVRSFTRMTAAAPDRLGDSLDKKILDIAELRGADPAQSSLRVMISEGNLKLLTTTIDEETGKLATTTIETNGRPTFITTATNAEIDAELLNRLFIISIDESRTQTENIIKFETRKYKVLGADNGSEKPNSLFAPTLAKLTFIDKVVIPFSELLADKFPIPDGSELSVGPRRDFKKFLYLIGVSAWLHQVQRTILHQTFRDSKGETKESPGSKHIVASPVDFYIVWRIAGSGLLHTLFKLSERHKRVLDCFRDSDVSTVQQVAAKLGLSDNRTREFLESLTQKGYLTKDVAAKPYKYSETGQKADFAGTIGEFEDSLQSFEEDGLKKWLEENKFDVLQEIRQEQYVDPLDGSIVPVRAKRGHQKLEKEPDSSTISRIEPPEPTKPSIKEAEVSDSHFSDPLFSTIATKTAKLDRLKGLVTGKCAACSSQGRMDWQVTYQDDSWGLLCAGCGHKLAQKIGDAS